MKLFKPTAPFLNRPIPCLGGHSSMRRVNCGVNSDGFGNFPHRIGQIHLEPSMLGIKPEPPRWPEREELIRSRIERRASSVDIPLSLRMIKKKQKLNEGCRYTGDSVQKVHSSMALIILELQRYALKMRESVSDDNFLGIIAHIRREMSDSFAWRFKQIFPQSPNMMIFLMTLLADFCVHSVATENSRNQQELGSLIGEPISCKCVVDRETYHLGSELNSGQNGDSEIVEKGVADIAVSVRDESSPRIGNQDLRLSIVSSDFLEPEQDNYVDYHRTDLEYQLNLSQDPNNSLLLFNYAQFLHLVARDYDRAEECFKRCIQVAPNDAEALNRYANFLWVVRMDLSAAEQMYLKALELGSGNTYYASTYADFLWSSGGEGTCFPLGK